MNYTALKRIGYSIMVLSSVVIIIVNLPRLSEIFRRFIENWVPVQAASSLIRDGIVAGGILLFLGAVLASYPVWIRIWRRSRVRWNPPDIEDIRQEIRKKENAGTLSTTEINSLHSAIDGLDGNDLEILRLLDETVPVILLRYGSSPADSFEDMAKNLSKSVSGLGGREACEGRLRKLKNNGLIRKEVVWSLRPGYTTQLGKRIAQIVREVSK